ncbi:hypothetical protein J6590_099723, partial [Homalodisca vitripennis]
SGGGLDLEPVPVWVQSDLTVLVSAASLYSDATIEFMSRSCLTLHHRFDHSCVDFLALLFCNDNAVIVVITQ